MYIGNATADEGAFRMLRGHGGAVLVCDQPVRVAQYTLLSPDKVAQFLTSILLAHRA